MVMKPLEEAPEEDGQVSGESGQVLGEDEQVYVEKRKKLQKKKKCRRRRRSEYHLWAQKQQLSAVCGRVNRLHGSYRVWLGCDWRPLWKVHPPHKTHPRFWGRLRIRNSSSVCAETVTSLAHMHESHTASATIDFRSMYYTWLIIHT